MSDTRWTVSIDAGGTFTDAVARRTDGQVLEAKVASTPDDPSRGLSNALNALADIGVSKPEVSVVCHGTTVATNATLTGNLARVALVTTRGYRDVLGYRTSSRPGVYSLTPDRPHDLVPRSLRYEITERLDSSGSVVEPLQTDELDAIVADLKSQRPEAVAVSLLFSYLDDTHEKQIGEALRAALPETPVTLSSEVAREFREYPRTATAAINAALRPIVESYLNRASEALTAEGISAPFLVMQSNGGGVPAERAGAEAHRLVLSGPAGGVAGLVALAGVIGTDNLISLDMGGTSTDVCLVRGRQIPFTTFQEVQDHTLLAPSVDIHTIGAGGGSIAWIDQTKRLRVGPDSARAVPGPASYGRGGTEPTITDAHVVLGTLGTSELAGGLRLDREAAVAAVKRVGDPLGMDPVEAAEAILAVGLAHMIRALRKVSVERGLDPRDFSLVPFGGAGPLHLGMLLRHMNLRNAILPMRPGLFSADGLLVAGLRIDDSQTLLTQDGEEAYAQMADWFAEAAETARTQLLDDGVAADAITMEASVDCRYQGQGFELNIPLIDWSDNSLHDLADGFHTAHEERYGHSNRGEVVEIVTVRLASTGEIDRLAEVAERVTARELPADAVVENRRITIPGYGEQVTPVVDRTKISPGTTFTGPAIIQQMDATTVILPRQTVEVLSTGDLVVTDTERKEQHR